MRARQQHSDPSPKPARVLARGLWASLALALAGACSARPPAPPPPPGWFEVAVAATSREEPSDPQLDEALGLGLGGGYDLARGEAARAGLEFGFSFARHKVQLPSTGAGDPRLDTFTISLGGRAAADLARPGLGAHVRGGGFYRAENDSGDIDLADNRLGAYVGAGLDLWYRHDAALSLFVTHLEGEDDLQESAIGLSARFYFAPDPWPETEQPDWW